MSFINKAYITAILVALAWQRATAIDTVLQLHGSGTTNPSKCYWHLMDQIMDRAKPLLRLTYRAVGSSTGQYEFMGVNNTGNFSYVNMNDFGSGDIPLPTESYNALQKAGKGMVHLPILMGAISFFHSVPGVGSDRVSLDACTLAKVFQRKIKFWDDEQIALQNPNMELPYENYPISVAHRVLGSSSTSSITQYLHQACPSEWPADKVGSEIVWEEDTMECDSSGLMVACLREQPGTIGYADAGHALQEGLEEVALMNLAGRRVSSVEAAENGGVGDALVNVPPSADMDFGGVNLINQDGDYTWPIVALSYVYVRKDLSFLEPDERSLLVFFLKQLYNDDYIGQCRAYGFEIVPESVRQIGLAGIDMLFIDGESTPWTLEGKSTQPGVGQGEYVISAKRSSYAEVVRNQNAYDIAALDSKMKSGDGSSPGGFQESHDGAKSASASSSSQDTVTFTEKEMGMVRAALGLGITSMILWVLTIGAFMAKRKGVM